ncbi:MAG TPA: amidohydrolase family protein [Myxococcaceae bacterium]|nr:amidohydrolase family protein [Myxococcaceae bacterium]
MEGRLVLKKCSIFRADGRIRNDMAVVVEGGLVTQVAPDAEVPVLPGDWEVACRDRIVVPGLVDCHTHLVGAQLAPLSGAFLLRNARARFDLQTKLALEVTRDELEALTAFGVARALRGGVTLVVEHLQAPNDVGGALAAQARVAEKLGVRLITSHATHSGRGGAPPMEQVEANAEFARNYRNHPLVRGALGFHSSSTADDELLRRIGRLREELGVGAHYHLAENEDDLAATFALSGKRVVPRLEPFGLIGPGVVGSYARTVDRLEAERLAKSRTLVALSPRTNLSTELGGSGLESVLTQQAMLGLGTAGSGTLWQELLAAFVGAIQIARVGRLLDPDGLMAQMLISGPAELCSMVYGAPSGNVEPGCLADLVVYDLVPSRENLSGLATHLLMQLGEVPVGWTIVNGRVTVREGQLLGIDFLELAANAARAVEAVWHRAGLGDEPPIAA